MKPDFETGIFTRDEIEKLKGVLQEACNLLGVPSRSRDVTRDALAGAIATLALGGTRDPQLILRQLMYRFQGVT